MFQRILVPLDGTALSEKAIPVAAWVARASDGTIIFVDVVLPPVEFGTYSPDRTVSLKPGAFEKREADANTYLSDVLLRYANDLAGIKTETDVVAGAASSEIYSKARLEHTDLIVISSKEETGLKRWVFGSLAEEVVSHSNVPVLVLQEQE
jgi:nucleotide-binding universal stress UspA family protein